MSLLVFVMPEMFHNKMQTLKNVFSMFPKGVEQREKTKFESERIAQAKNIMKPFFLRRLKSEVLQGVSLYFFCLFMFSFLFKSKSLSDHWHKKKWSIHLYVEAKEQKFCLLPPNTKFEALEPLTSPSRQKILKVVSRSTRQHRITKMQNL